MVPTGDREVQWYALLVKALAPPGSEAWFDWTSGVTFLNHDRAGYDAYRKDAKSNMALAQAITHEAVHFMQAGSCGFLTRWARDQFQLLSQAMRELGLPVASLEETATILRNAAAALPPELRVAIRRHRERLDERGPAGLTVRALFEGHALFVQLHQHVGPMNAGTIRQMLDRCSPDPAYRFAYDLASTWLLDAGFRAFTAICFTSLCCTSPTDAFVTLCRAVQRGDLLAVDQPLDGHAFGHLAREVLGTSLIGTAGDLQVDVRSLNPVYRRVDRTTRLGGLRFRDAALLLDQPSRLFAHVLQDLVTPLAFRPDNEGVEVGVQKRPGGGFVYEYNDVFLALLLSAINSRVLAASAAPPAATGEHARHRWLQTRSDRALLLKVPRQGDPGPDGAAFVKQLAQKPARVGDPSALAHTWGRFVFEVDIGPGVGLGAAPAVRRFVASMASEAPWWPLHLYMDARAAAFMIWFGGLASEDAWAGTRFDAAHPSVMQAVMQGLDAAFRRAEEIGQDPTALVLAITSVYPGRRAARLLAGCSYWQKQLARILSEIDFMSERARAATVTTADRSTGLRLIARAMAILADVGFILDADQVDDAVIAVLQKQLQRGDSVIVIDRQESPLLSSFAHDWGAFCVDPQTTIARGHYVLRLSDDIRSLGFLSVVRAGLMVDQRTEGFEVLGLHPPEAEALERLGACSVQPMTDALLTVS
jgi:hypothetical protein